MTISLQLFDPDRISYLIIKKNWRDIATDVCNLVVKVI